MPKVIQFRNDLDAELVERFRSFCEDKGMAQKVVVTKIFNWFLDQDPTIQLSVLGMFPESIAPDIARLILQRMAGEGEGSRVREEDLQDVVTRGSKSDLKKYRKI